MGWSAVKWIGKKLWAGIKKFAAKARTMFQGLFKIFGRFKNKVSNWTTILGKGIKDASYRFLVKPIASMVTTVVGFFTGMVEAPANFM